jgi:uncharacterized RDD family membrane protein YckC
MSESPAGSAAPPAAELDRRFYAFAVDRLLAWSVSGAVAWLACVLLIDSDRLADRLAVGLAVALAAVLATGAVLAVVLGLRGTSPGMAMMGIRLLGEATGTPIGVGPALLRQVVLGAATLPTFGLGTATLAWTVVTDPAGRRRGWHDHVAHSVVVDVRPGPDVTMPGDPRPRHVVNLTAMRLVPAPQGPPAGHQGLGPPLVPSATVPVTGPVPLTRWRVCFDSGESLVIEGLALIGRQPESRPGEQVRHLVPLHSGDLSLSKTHAQLQVTPDGALVVADRGSTNGSILLRGGVARELPAGRPTTLLDGDHVRFGDRDMAVTGEA